MMPKRRKSSAKTAKVSSFPFVARDDARVLILGSMPGVESLRQAQYYAHPRNAFWRIMGEVLGFPQDTPYEQRLAVLSKRKIALWDVLEHCVREGSLDADICEEHPNRLDSFLSTHKHIRLILCNGQTAHTLFMRHFGAFAKDRGIEVLRLPSTSPAHAAKSYGEKLALWREALAKLI